MNPFTQTSTANTGLNHVNEAINTRLGHGGFSTVYNVEQHLIQLMNIERSLNDLLALNKNIEVYRSVDKEKLMLRGVYDNLSSINKVGSNLAAVQEVLPVIGDLKERLAKLDNETVKTKKEAEDLLALVKTTQAAFKVEMLKDTEDKVKPLVEANAELLKANKELTTKLETKHTEVSDLASKLKEANDNHDNVKKIIYHLTAFNSVYVALESNKSIDEVHARKLIAISEKAGNSEQYLRQRLDRVGTLTNNRDRNVLALVNKNAVKVG